MKGQVKCETNVFIAESKLMLKIGRGGMSQEYLEGALFDQIW